MSYSWSKVRAVGVVALALPLAVGAGAPAFAATPPAGAYGDSYGLEVDVTALSGAVPVQVPPQARATSSCPVGGGEKANSILEVPADPLANVKVSHDTANADCGAKSGTAKSRIVDATALIDTPAEIHADAITSESTTTCAKAPVGSTQILNLSIAGQAIPIPTDVPPNTAIVDPVLNLLGLRIIANEQHPAAQGRGLVVNGLHIIASGEGAAIPVGGAVIRGDIVIAHAVSGVVCPGGPGSDNGGLPKPDISFFKSASPSVAKAGDTVTYTAVITNTNKTAGCDVLKLIDHIAPAFELVSSSGPLGTALEKPAPSRPDGGVDAVLRPTGVTIGAGKSVTQQFVVKVKDDAKPGTYYDTLELFCGVNGDYVSGPLAPVTVPAPGQVVEPPDNNVEQPPAGPTFAPTGLNTLVPGIALLLLVGAVGTRRLVLSRR